MGTLKYREGILLGCIVALAVFLRIAGAAQPYHQDEYKWAVEANPGDAVESIIPHPPLALFIYSHVGALIGYDHLRYIPAAASLITLVFLWRYVRRRWGESAALVSSALFAGAPYALLGSLQIDIDGAFLPLAAMLAFFGYEEWREGNRAGLWTLGAGLVLGFGFKLSFVLVPAALLLDVLWRNPAYLRPLLARRVLIPAALAAGACALALGLFWEDIWFLRYVDNFLAIGGRDYFQILFQSAKACIYLSPILFVSLFALWRERRELSAWTWFVLVNILFYFVIFDFSHRTFDRYLLFLVLPAAVCAGVVLGRALNRRAVSWALSAGVLALAASWALFSLPHQVFPLIPKTQFIHAFLSFHWDFLLPMTGGSGPLGFYLPIDALALLWAASFAAGAALFFVPKMRTAACGILLGVGAAYVGIVDLEYLSGHFYGSAGAVVRALVDPLSPADVPGGVLTYNDVGAYELIEKGIYSARFYPHPEFVADNIDKFRAHQGYYMVVEIPRLNEASTYERFFSSCKPVRAAQDGLIEGFLYDCRNANYALLSP